MIISTIPRCNELSQQGWIHQVFVRGQQDRYQCIRRPAELSSLIDLSCDKDTWRNFIRLCDEARKLVRVRKTKIYDLSADPSTSVHPRHEHGPIRTFLSAADSPQQEEYHLDAAMRMSRNEYIELMKFREQMRKLAAFKKQEPASQKAEGERDMFGAAEMHTGEERGRFQRPIRRSNSAGQTDFAELKKEWAKRVNAEVPPMPGQPVGGTFSIGSPPRTHREGIATPPSGDPADRKKSRGHSDEAVHVS